MNRIGDPRRLDAQVTGLALDQNPHLLEPSDDRRAVRDQEGAELLERVGPGFADDGNEKLPIQCGGELARNEVAPLGLGQPGAEAAPKAFHLDVSQDLGAVFSEEIRDPGRTLVSGPLQRRLQPDANPPQAVRRVHLAVLEPVESLVLHDAEKPDELSGRLEQREHALLKEELVHSTRVESTPGFHTPGDPFDQRIRPKHDRRRVKNVEPRRRGDLCRIFPRR
ncbi:hypothetical protein WME99_34460 [Sorangium sp. So ce136]|uniref:hypothetical protein n=1 Tax=Sorangium sp. So ce136 TaxID=3133284 RepID=UPI003EFC8638